jgi:hypothetical protein
MPKGVYQRKARGTVAVMASLERRLMEQSIPEPNSGCWLFTGTLVGGYGRIAENKYVRTLAHRASYRVFKAEIPNGMDVLHKCDNPCCINPDHLSVGTHVENMADMVRKGRSNNGRCAQ